MNTVSFSKGIYPLVLWATVLMFWALSAISGSPPKIEAKSPFGRHLKFLDSGRSCKTIKIFPNGNLSCEENFESLNWFVSQNKK